MISQWETKKKKPGSNASEFNLGKKTQTRKQQPKKRCVSSLCQLCEVRILLTLQRKMNILNSDQLQEELAIYEKSACEINPVMFLKLHLWVKLDKCLSKIQC